MQQTPWQTAWEEANRLFQNGNFEGAEQKLTLITADNPLFQAAKKLRAETIYNQAMQALQENRLSSSLKDCQRSLQLEPTDERIMNLRTQLLNQAKALFMRGYLKELSSPKEAKQIYEEVMERLNPIQKESELNRYWLRAQERLANL
jgi:tetratricopeptide (TPR) repeat protein